MTLPKLAALAAKVEGFKSPTCDCSECDEGTVVDQFGDDAKACRSCNGAGFKPDNSPAALLMAVMVFVYKNCIYLQSGDWESPNKVHIKNKYGRGAGRVSDSSEESIARAALVALLRAHGVEVSSE